MICPKCGGPIKSTDSVHTEENETYRRKKCKLCSHVFYTVEFEVERDENFKETWYGNHRSYILRDYYKNKKIEGDC